VAQKKKDEAQKKAEEEARKKVMEGQSPKDVLLLALNNFGCMT
jgi:hypothetical protein